MPKPLYYTFGNHMHWVDMQWLWGYGVLPGSVRDMLELCRQTGARGNVNFDGIGYEKMAAECPDALAELRDAVRAGTIEPVGCSYGQPYGLFHGGESNIRQLTYGARTVQRLLGVRPRAFWEEEFYFFPQLPQMLAGCGFTGACLFFQWTWHTPEVPREPHNLILWEGIDGTRLPTLPRNSLNVHQWPEDFDGLLDSGLINDLDTPAIVQWLELMPSRDWMCRSEVLLPRLKSLFADPRFEIRPRTVSQLITDLQSPERQRGASPPPVRAYSMDDVWHGMTLGKNADRHPRASRQTEAEILDAEAISALAGLLGRPYPSWDAYPTWELEEAWRDTLAAQHHDNHECEGLCGFVADGQFLRARMLAGEVHGRAHRQLSDRAGEPLALNSLGFDREVLISAGTDDDLQSLTVPPFGYATLTAAIQAKRPVTVTRDGRVARIQRGDLIAEVDAQSAALLQIRSAEHPEGVLAGDVPLGGLTRTINGRSLPLPPVREVEINDDGVTLWLEHDQLPSDSVNTLQTGSVGMMISITIPPDARAVDLTIHGLEDLARPDPGFAAALRMPIAPRWEIAEVRADTPFATAEIRGGPPARRKYPRGDWMTSPQWFEDVEGSITAHRFVDLLGSDGSGLLVLHDRAQQFFRTARGLDSVICAYDPWDERRYNPDWHAQAAFRIVPHRGMPDSTRIREAMIFTADSGRNIQFPERHPHHPPVGGGAPENASAPHSFGALDLSSTPNILAHAFFRESPKSGEGLPDWAGHRMFRDSAGACDHPYIIRLVEWDGHPAEVLLKLPGPVALAAKTNLLGEVAPHIPGTAWLDIIPDIEPPSWAKFAKLRGRPIPWSALRFTMRPREIATIYADLVLGRKEWRDLDAKREVWATVHRDPGASS